VFSDFRVIASGSVAQVQRQVVTISILLIVGPIAAGRCWPSLDQYTVIGNAIAACQFNGPPRRASASVVETTTHDRRRAVRLRDRRGQRG
jgi:hypothetical protein